jgi:hypothetical protein
MNEMFDPLRVKAVLEETLTTVLADMAFLDCQPVSTPDQAVLTGLSHCVAIDALKPGSFRIEIRVGEAFRKKIVSMLFDASTAEPGSPEASEADLLLEILNVATGNFMTTYFGPECAPKLELPRYLYFSDPAEGNVVAQTFMDAEGDFIQVTLRSIRYRY